MKTFYLFFNLVIAALLSSCVGTIKDNADSPKESVSTKRVKLIFDGIADAAAIAHSKIYVSFKPALGGSGNYSYKVYLDGNRVSPAVAITATPQDIDSKGFLHATVENLAIGSTHTVLVKAYDKDYDSEDDNNAELTVSTLNYEVPLFDGLASIENVPGVAGETQLLVKWNMAQAASESSDVFSTNPQAVSGYNIYLGQSEDTLSFFSSVNNANASELLLTNLIPGTNYFVRVRAKNSTTPPKEELNYEVAQKKTQTTSAISFPGISSIELPSTAAGLNSFKINWSAGTGSYDRYRIFVSSIPRTYFNPSLDTPYTSDITNLGNLFFTMGTATPHTTYYAAVVACNNPSCTLYQGHDKVLSIKTSPPVAPFNGIATMVQPSGTAGLNSVNITWALPDTTRGIYDQIRIFKSNSAGVYDPLLDQVSTYPNGTGTIGYNLILTTTTGTRIEGMSLGTEYCFVAEAYSTTPFDPANPNGRSTNSRIPFCITPNYVYPSFLGVNSQCSNVTGSSLKVSWLTPNPMGIFSNYEIFVYPSQTGFSFTDAISGAPGYTRLAAASTATNYEITGLAPASNYQIGIKTFFQDGTGTKYYDTNQTIASCSTSSGKVIHGGWEEIMAIGPKIDGITGQAKTEKITKPGDASFLIKAPVEDSLATPGITGSNQGIVRLVWEDFQLTDSLGRMYDFATTPNSGYKIYRKTWISAHNTLRPTLSDSDWGAALNSDYIVPIRNYDSGTGEEFIYGEFNDYTVTQPAQADTAKAYWYKVEAFINNVKIGFDIQPLDTVLKVILPPNNMALIHRWMMNKQVCKSILRNPDKNNNYRCLFNGIGSTNGYYDYGGHYLMDRFELGCNFTLGSDTNAKCSELSGTNALWLGRTTNAAYGVKAGDCMGGVQNYASEQTTHPGSGANPLTGKRFQSVAYWRNRSLGGCFINTTAGAIGTAGTTWLDINSSSLEATSVSTALSIFPQYKAGVYGNGLGLGKIIATNNANMPPITEITQARAHKICRGHTVAFNSLTYFKRLPTQEEYFHALPMNRTASRSIIKNIQSGDQETGLPDRDCKGQTSPSSNGPTIVDYKEPTYPSSSLAGGGLTTMATGSAGQNSSELCVSKFGVQDLYGSVREWTLDQLSCMSGFGCSAAYTDLNNSPPGTAFIPLSPTESKERLRNGDGQYVNMAQLALVNDPDVTSFLPPIDNITYYFDNYANTSTGSLSAYRYDVNRYVSPVNGMPLACTGAACGAGSDDNLLITGLKPAYFTGDANYVVEYQSRLNDFKNRRHSSSIDLRATNAVVGTQMRGHPDGNYGGGVSLFNYYSSTTVSSKNATGARCGVKLPENAAEVIQAPIYD